MRRPSFTIYEYATQMHVGSAIAKARYGKRILKETPQRKVMARGI
jgi:hypothetical protein